MNKSKVLVFVYFFFYFMVNSMNDNKNLMNNNKLIDFKNNKALIVSTLNKNTLQNIILKSVNEVLEKYNINIEFIVVNKNDSKNQIEKDNYIYFSDFYSEKDIVINKLKKFNNFDFTVQTDEEAVDILGTINTELNLKGIKIEDSRRFRDKTIMKKLLSNNIKKPNVYDFENINNINKFPVVLKPIDSAGSSGVKILRSLNELNSEIKMLKNRNLLINYEIEEFISAPIYHIDGFVFNKNIIFCSASEYIGDCYRYLLGDPLGSVRCTEELQLKALLFSQNIHKCLHFPDGVFHIEAFFKDNDFIFLEVGIRPGGAEVIPAIEEVTGINLSVEHVLLQLGIENRPILNKYKYYGWLNFPSVHLSKNKLKIKSIKYPDKSTLKSLKRNYCPNINEEIDRTRVVYAQKLGAFVFASNNRNDILNDINLIKKEFKVEFY